MEVKLFTESKSNLLNQNQNYLDIKNEMLSEEDEKIKYDSPIITQNNLSTNLLSKEIKTFPLITEKTEMVKKFSQDLKLNYYNEEKDENLDVSRKNLMKRKLISSCKPLQRAYNENKKFVQIYKDKMDKNISLNQLFYDKRFNTNTYDTTYSKESTRELDIAKSIRITHLGGANNQTITNTTPIKKFLFLTEKLDHKANTNINFYKSDTNVFDIYNKIFDNNLEEAGKYNSVRFVALKSSKRINRPEINNTCLPPKKEDYFELKMLNKNNLEKRTTTMNFVGNKALKRGILNESQKKQKIINQDFNKLNSIGKGFGKPETSKDKYKVEQIDAHFQRLEMIRKYQNRLFKNGKSKEKKQKLKERVDNRKSNLNLFISNSNNLETTPLSTDAWYTTYHDTSEVNFTKNNYSKEIVNKKKMNTFYITCKREPFLNYKKREIPKNNYLFDLNNKKDFSLKINSGNSQNHNNIPSIFKNNIFEEMKKKKEFKDHTAFWKKDKFKDEQKQCNGPKDDNNINKLSDKNIECLI